ncbi:hypothetical protein AXG93_3241s1110 [Marchantia polymorpha subsp. ruderalis]|uniref:Uncharacterized protein n=1 Tax=Marchantia polymorpha subsp. ruderalis TaxID=1480154 RepID=A0A176W7Y5_MARPO|nr:hypothetical protein AXG93_3241s1110 [Marchantia polymorpha subsp. ruderalis]
MKARRLILEEDSGTKRRTAALRERHAVEDVVAAESGPQKVVSPLTSTDTVILETSEEPSVDETESLVLGAADLLSVQVLSLLKYLYRKREKYAESRTNESYVEMVRNRKRIKVAVAAQVAAKERRSQPTEMKYQALEKRLTEEVEKRRKAEQVSEGLREDVKRAKCTSVDLLKRLEACRTAYYAESLKVDELSAAAKEKEQEYQTELSMRAKNLTEYETARILDLELIEKLEAQCGELRTQRSQAEEQLCEVEAKLTEAEGKNWQLLEETRDALTTRVERCLRGYVLWQIESHNRLRLREIEHRAEARVVSYQIAGRGSESGARISKCFENIRFRA